MDNEEQITFFLTTTVLFFLLAGILGIASCNVQNNLATCDAAAKHQVVK